jgi:hypothetical protein
MPKSPFDFDDGFENIPIVKTPVQVVKQAGTAVVKQTAQQAKKTAQTVFSQLSGSGDQLATNDDQQHADKGSDPMTHSKTMQGQKTANNANTQTPEEQEKLKETREKLRQHTQSYSSGLDKVGEHLETEIKRREEERKQAEQKRKQEEEEEKQKKKQEKEQQDQEQPVATGKGRMRMGQKQKKANLASDRARTKTEVKTAGAG